ncbi:hypothetical protein KS4_07560 [Poriferisphaera corsica]|uniref:Uncharacterized protein n=1 Tax=Poriferisphaera corsica TaxID=2528020 RepID=A0A517YR70_9BACT|nr:hypothetical protein KS4_07560 [Poriferisphaera corsica]
MLIYVNLLPMMLLLIRQIMMQTALECVPSEDDCGFEGEAEVNGFANVFVPKAITIKLAGGAGEVWGHLCWWDICVGMTPCHRR